MDIYEGYTVKKHTEKINISNEIVYRSKKRTFIKDFICLDTETSHQCIYNTDGSLDKEKSKTCYVICSEEVFPNDFTIVAKQDKKRTVALTKKQDKIEKLGVYKDGLLGNLKI